MHSNALVSQPFATRSLRCSARHTLPMLYSQTSAPCRVQLCTVFLVGVYCCGMFRAFRFKPLFGCRLASTPTLVADIVLQCFGGCSFRHSFRSFGFLHSLLALVQHSRLHRLSPLWALWFYGVLYEGSVFGTAVRHTHPCVSWCSCSLLCLHLK